MDLHQNIGDGDSRAHSLHCGNDHSNFGSMNHRHNFSSSPYIYVSSAPPSSAKSPMDGICNAMSRLGKRVEGATRKAEGLVDNVWHHLKTSPSLTDAAMARFAQGTKLLTEGGHDKIFKNTFQTCPGEMLLKAYACYLSTSSGPVIGTLYISSKRIAFSSDYPLCRYTSLGHQEWMYYKVVIYLDQLRAVIPSTNRFYPSEKYIQIITRDGHEFWLMGFISYDKALKNLSEAFQHHHDNNGGVPLN